MSTQENDHKLFHNSIKYLHNISTLPQINIPALKSSICLKRTLMAHRKNIHLPTSATRPNMHCPRCFLNFYDGPATYKVKSKSIQYKFAEKILTKRKKGLPLTKYQQKYLEKNQKFAGNSLVTTCHFCKKETGINLEKPATKPNPKIIKNTNSVTKKKKKNRKKDRLCGLNENVIANMILNNADKKRNKKLTKKQLFSNTGDSLAHTTPDDSLILTSDYSPNVYKNNSLNTLEIEKSSSKRPLEVINLDSDDSIQEMPTKRKCKIKKKPEAIIETSTPLITAKIKKKMEKNRDKLSKFMTNSNKKDTSSDLLQLLQASEHHPSEVITLDSDDSVQEVPKKTEEKYPQPICTSTPAVKNKKKKNKNYKLCKLVDNLEKKKKSSNLFNFLKSF